METQQKFTFADIVAAYGGLYGSIDVWCEDIQGTIGEQEDDSWCEFYPATYAKSDFFRQYFGFAPYSKDKNTVYITVRARGKVAAQFLKYRGRQQKRKFRAILIGFFTAEKKTFANGETGDRIVLTLKTFDGIQGNFDESERKPVNQEPRTYPSPAPAPKPAPSAPAPAYKAAPVKRTGAFGLPPGITIGN